MEATGPSYHQRRPEQSTLRLTPASPATGTGLVGGICVGAIGRYRSSDGGSAQAGEPLRVIAGLARGRRLEAPPGPAVRPTSDRMREALFSMLDARLGGLDDLRVADLACGSGALGIEALSRGAASCAFVDLAGRSLRTARANLDAVGLGDAAVTFVRADLVQWSRQQEPGTFDLVLADPPYAWDGWVDLLQALAGSAAAVAAESDREVTPPAGWASLRTRRHGGSVVTVLVPDQDSDR